MTLVRRALAPGEANLEGWGLLVGACLIVLAVVAPDAPALAPVRCPLKALSGVPCPTCGSVRAIAALAACNPARALRMNPLITLGTLALLGWLAHAAVAVAFNGPRWRLEWDDADLLALRLTATLAVVSTWLFLIADGR